MSGERIPYCRNKGHTLHWFFSFQVNHALPKIKEISILSRLHAVLQSEDNITLPNSTPYFGQDLTTWVITYWETFLTLPTPPLVLISWSFFRLGPLLNHWNVNCLLAGSSRLTEENACSVLTPCSAFYMKRKNKQTNQNFLSLLQRFNAIIIIIAFIVVSYFWSLLRFFTCWNVFSFFVFSS